MKIRVKIALVVFLSVFFPLAGAGVYLYYSQSAAMKTNVGQILKTVGNATARSMDQFIVQRGPELKLVSGSSTLRATPEAANYGLSRYLSTFTGFDSFTFTDPAGNVIASQGDILLSKGEHSLEKAVSRWYTQAVAGAKLVDVIAEPGEFSRYLVYIVPVVHNDQNYGWLFGQVNSEKIAQTAIAVEVGDTGVATLFNKDGILIGHRNKARYGYDMSKYPIMADPIQRDVGNPGDTFVSGDGREKWGLTILFPETMKHYDLKWGIIVDQATAELFAPIRQIRNSVLISIVVCLLIFVPIGFLIAVRSISNPIQRMVSHLTSMAHGDFSVRIDPSDIKSKDEIGQLAGAMNTMAAKQKELVRELLDNSSTLSSSSEKLSAVSSQMASSADEMSSQSEMIASASEQVSASVDTVASAAEQASSSVSNIAHMTEEMSSTFKNVADSSHKTAAKVNDMTDSIKEISNGITNVAAAVEEMSASLNEVAKNTSQANHISKEANRQSEDINERMNNLVGASKQIGKIVGVIKDIADQTNMLALNATIEAAGAGEAGKGFAVVAGEVKELAKQSAEATDEIAGQIEQIQKTTSDAVNGILEISKIISEIASINENNASAVEEQTATSSEISRTVSGNATSVDKVVKSADETSKLVDEIASATSETAKTAGEVAKHVDELSLGVREVASSSSEAAKGVQEIYQNIQAINEAAKQTATGASQTSVSSTDLSKMAQKLNALVQTFKL